MKLLLINPNITAAVTDLIAVEAHRSASPGTEINAVTARFGTQYLENRIEAAIAGHAVLDVLATHMADHDAAIVAAFGDPGLGAAREFADIPIFGIEESALLTAWTLGRRIAIVCLTPRLGRWYQECAEEHGLAGRLVSIRPLDVPITDIAQAKDQLRTRLLQECVRAIELDGAEVIIFGGAPIAGLAREATSRIPVPVLDGVSCAVRLAEAIVGLRPRSPSRGSFARPMPKTAQGLSPALTRRVEGNEASDTQPARSDPTPAPRD
jgi:Asp/Glu/hydantoin racemase